MSDFLKHLAARSFSSHTTLRPKTRSIFEPMGKAAVIGPAEMELEELSDAPSERGRRSSSTAEVGQDEVPEESRRGLGFRPDGGKERYVAQESTVEPREAPKAEAPERTNTRVLDREAPTTERAEVSLFDHARAVERPGVPERTEANRQFAAHVGDRTQGGPAVAKKVAGWMETVEENAAPQRPRRDNAPPEPKPTAPPKERPAALQPLSRPTVAAIVKDAAAMPTQRSKAEVKDSSAKALEADTERTINISIGRIDVVAEASPITSRPAAKKSQSGISLEDYLRQKKAGGMG